MTGIVLSASVRQNLLSLQSTASLLATTQNDLATGNKVNSALDNPTSYFTAAALNNRASDISNLLDGIGNGVQVLQAANTGITSLQSLVASAQSVANQVLQTPVGYSTKSSVRPRRSPAPPPTTCSAPAPATPMRPSLGTAATATVDRGLHQRGGNRPAPQLTRRPTSVDHHRRRLLLVGTAGATSTTCATALTNGSIARRQRQDHHLHDAPAPPPGSAAAGFTIGIGTSHRHDRRPFSTDIDAITGTAPPRRSLAARFTLQTGHDLQPDDHRLRQRACRLGLGTGVTHGPRRRRGHHAGACRRPRCWPGRLPAPAR